MPIYKVVKGKRKRAGLEWHEVCFVRYSISQSRRGPEDRYLVKRDVLVEQPQLPGMEKKLSLPFPTMQLKGKEYKELRHRHQRGLGLANTCSMQLSRSSR